jgi:hypothetical protein
VSDWSGAGNLGGDARTCIAIASISTTGKPSAKLGSTKAIRNCLLFVQITYCSMPSDLLDDIQGAMEGLLEPEMVEETLGQVEVRAVFPVRKGAVAGCYVLSGKVTRNCNLQGGAWRGSGLALVSLTP